MNMSNFTRLFHNSEGSDNFVPLFKADKKIDSKFSTLVVSQHRRSTCQNSGYTILYNNSKSEYVECETASEAVAKIPENKKNMIVKVFKGYNKFP